MPDNSRIALLILCACPALAGVAWAAVIRGISPSVTGFFIRSRFRRYRSLAFWLVYAFLAGSCATSERLLHPATRQAVIRNIAREWHIRRPREKNGRDPSIAAWHPRFRPRNDEQKNPKR